MTSTIEREFLSTKGKELPNWYGIENIGFVWHSSWSDPEIEYNGKRINAYIVEDTMWERFREECEEEGKNADSCIDEFDDYMKTNSEYVYELIELALGNQI